MQDNKGESYGRPLCLLMPSAHAKETPGCITTECLQAYFSPSTPKLKTLKLRRLSFPPCLSKFRVLHFFFLHFQVLLFQMIYTETIHFLQRKAYSVLTGRWSYCMASIYQLFKNITSDYQYSYIRHDGCQVAMNIVNGSNILGSA